MMKNQVNWHIYWLFNSCLWYKLVTLHSSLNCNYEISYLLSMESNSNLGKNIFLANNISTSGMYYMRRLQGTKKLPSYGLAVCLVGDNRVGSLCNCLVESFFVKTAKKIICEYLQSFIVLLHSRVVVYKMFIIRLFKA